MKNESDFKEIGDLSKKIRNDLFILMKMSQEMKMRKKETNEIAKTIKHLDEYRSKAENFMFTQGINDLGIFYPGESDE